jgi:hypothetical protein
MVLRSFKDAFQLLVYKIQLRMVRRKGFESVKMRVFWDIAPYSLAGVDRRFRREYYVNHQGDESLHYRLYIPQDSHLHIRRRENLKYHVDLKVGCREFITHSLLQ